VVFAFRVLGYPSGSRRRRGLSFITPHFTQRSFFASGRSSGRGSDLGERDCRHGCHTQLGCESAGGCGGVLSKGTGAPERAHAPTPPAAPIAAVLAIDFTYFFRLHCVGAAVAEVGTRRENEDEDYVELRIHAELGILILEHGDESGG